MLLRSARTAQRAERCAVFQIASLACAQTTRFSANFLRSPVNGKPWVAPVTARCVDTIEALAEKFRAALSHREPAIRDFFDIDYAVRKGLLRQEVNDYGDRVGLKLANPENDSVKVSQRRLDAFRRQVQAELKPVLRARDFAAVDLNRAFYEAVDLHGAEEAADALADSASGGQSFIPPGL